MKKLQGGSAIPMFIQDVKRKGVVFAVRAWVRKVRTVLYKRFIYFQDRYGLFSYQRWLRENEPARSEVSRTAGTTSFSFFILVSDQSARWKDSLASLQAQVSGNWQAWVVFVEGGPAEAPLVEDERVHRLFWPAAPTIDQFLAQTGSEWLGVLQAGDTLSPNALALFEDHFARNLQVEIIYTDQDHLAADGKTRQSPFFWPDWSPELLFSANYLSQAVVRRELLADLAEVSFWEAILRSTEKINCQIGHIPKVLCHIRHQSSGVPQAAQLPPEVLAAHLERTGASRVNCELLKDGRVHFTWQPADELITIIILSSDQAGLLERCVKSIFSFTSYPHFEVLIIENNSREAETFRCYEGLRKNPQVRIVEHNQPFNYSEFNNFGAGLAHGSLLLFLNNDTEMTEAGWLTEMARWAQRPGIGMVGAKLLYPNGLIQHAGVIVGLEGHAQHVFSGKAESSCGIFGSEGWYRNFSALTGACLMVRRDVFDQIGGFDPHYRIAFGDVELCLRARAAGFRIIYTPFARLVHHEGMTRASYNPPEDIRYSRSHFLQPVQAGDPFYNPNLSYAVRIPTFRRRGEEDPGERFEYILALMG